jgi:hypothetical protein
MRQNNTNKILTTRSNNVDIFKEMPSLAAWPSLNEHVSSWKIILNTRSSKQAYCVWLSCLQSVEWWTHSAQSVLRQTVLKLCQYRNYVLLKKTRRETASSVLHQAINWMLYLTNWRCNSLLPKQHYADDEDVKTRLLAHTGKRLR